MHRVYRQQVAAAACSPLLLNALHRAGAKAVTIWSNLWTAWNLRNSSYLCPCCLWRSVRVFCLSRYVQRQQCRSTFFQSQSASAWYSPQFLCVWFTIVVRSLAIWMKWTHTGLTMSVCSHDSTRETLDGFGWNCVYTMWSILKSYLSVSYTR